MAEGMGEAQSRRGRTGLRRGRLLLARRDGDAAAGVVSIMLSILVIIILLTLVTTVWMPNWTEKMEQNHMREVTDQFGNLKSNIDRQILKGDTKFVLGSPITLGTEGFALFGEDARGTFTINHFKEDELEFYCNVRNESGEINVTATGGMKYTSNNNQYVDQTIAYENGALILQQGKGQVVRVGPQLSVEKHGPRTYVTFVLITSTGVQASIQGKGTIMVRTQLVTYTSKEVLFDTPTWLNITMTSDFPKAWARYYNNTLIEGGLTNGVDFTTTVADNGLTVAMRDVGFFGMGFALMDVELQENAGGVSTGPDVSGLVGLWHLNAGAGTNAMDASAYHNDGTLVGAEWTTGVKGAGTHFNGSGEHVAVPEIPAYNVQEAITVMAWVRWTINPWNGSGWANIVSKAEDQWEIQHSGNATGTNHTNDAFEFAVETNVTRTWVWSHTVPGPNIWYHVAGVYDSFTELLYIYINGTLENTTALNGSINVRNQGITFGARDHGGYDRFFEGDVDEVMLFDRALAPGEIYRYYQSLKP